MRVFCGKDTDTDTDSVYFSTELFMVFQQGGQVKKYILSSMPFTFFGTPLAFFGKIFKTQMQTQTQAYYTLAIDK